jgi:hypothetical protein
VCEELPVYAKSAVLALFWEEERRERRKRGSREEASVAKQRSHPPRCLRFLSGCSHRGRVPLAHLTMGARIARDPTLLLSAAVSEQTPRIQAHRTLRTRGARMARVDSGSDSR